MPEPVGVLGRIAAAKRLELAERFDAVSLDALRASATQADRSLTRVLAKPGARFILEIKRASPSGGIIHSSADPAAIARGYAGVGDALSVLCDGPFFGGSLDDLRAARTQFDGPILAKDFFMDPRQVAEARIAGADAVLVMLSLLDDMAAREIISEASRFGMESLVEVHDQGEMQRALGLGAPLIGINNRDLRDLGIDLSTTERLAPLAADCLLVAESGIETRADLDRLAGHVDAFLIGSSLMRSSHPGQAARALLFGRTKLCGLNSVADLSAARPAAFAGFVFVHGSPRHVTKDKVPPLGDIARESGILPVGVFRDVQVNVVAEAARTLSLHAVQLHGHEDGDYVRALRQELPESCEIWTCLSVGREVPTSRGGDRLLFDNGAGGTGRTFDWSLIKEHPELQSSVLGGGVAAHNALLARQIGAYAIDVGSSVDLEPGKKCPKKIAALFDRLRPVSREAVRACA
jgi:indole-3-glycerol phosphate synthase/phosphoribosylanthranilate isomerase